MRTTEQLKRHMTLDEAKFKLSQKITLLKSYLKDVRIELTETESDSSENIEFAFHGYSYVDSFINDVETDLMFEIRSLINLCHLNELNIEKRSMLVSLIIQDLQSESFSIGFELQKNYEKLSVKQETKIRKFREVQSFLQNSIIKSLNDEYLSDSKYSQQKFQKIVWKGNQRELAELFERLTSKNWIEELLPNQKTAFYRTIAALFEVPDSDPKKMVSNFQDYNKPSSQYPLPTNGIFNSIQPNQTKINH